MKNLVFLKALFPLLILTQTAFCKTITVLEIDTGVDISHQEIRNHVNIANWEKEDYIDTHGHGTHVAGIILKDTCKEVELISCKYYVVNQNSFNNSINCFKLAINHFYNFINYSSGGHELNQIEVDTLKLINPKTKIVVAAGNDNANLKYYPYYPASYNLPNMVVVGNLDGTYKAASSNFGLPRMVWEQGTGIVSTLPGNRFGRMTGTSQATARHTNMLLKETCETK